MALAPKHADLNPRKLLIDGRWVDAQSGKTFRPINPATSEPICEVAQADAADMDLAVKAARTAFDQGPWPKMTGGERGRILYRLSELMYSRAAEIAELETMDAGKPISESTNVDVPVAAEVIQYYAGWASKVTGETLPPRGESFIYNLREPVGVVGAIVPWNFPLLLAMWKVGPALATGCTMVLKPSETTPLSVLKVGELALEAGVPPGVLNVVPGPGRSAGNALVEHPGVDKIAFTGSTAVGQDIMRRCAGTVKRLTLELGGKSPNVVFADADIDAAARGAVAGIFYNKGEVCAAGSRVLVERRVQEELVEKMKARAAKLTQGDTLDPKTRLGPQISEAQLKSVLSYVARGKEEGAKLALGGGRNEAAGKGYFLQPTIFMDATNEMTIAQEEIFGPVATVIPFDDEGDALQKANGVRYGLAAGVWTKDLRRAHRMARAIRAGTVWVNTYNLYDPGASFGGFKQSGFGRELGRAALEGYTEQKTVWIDLG
ncbi:MAG: aldehyde dehydrogenase family protein [Deltaproteobacteria bacterium]